MKVEYGLERTHTHKNYTLYTYMIGIEKFKLKTRVVQFDLGLDLGRTYQFIVELVAFTRNELQASDYPEKLCFQMELCLPDDYLKIMFT